MISVKSLGHHTLCSDQTASAVIGELINRSIKSADGIRAECLILCMSVRGYDEQPHCSCFRLARELIDRVVSTLCRKRSMIDVSSESTPPAVEYSNVFFTGTGIITCLGGYVDSTANWVIDNKEGCV